MTPDPGNPPAYPNTARFRSRGSLAVLVLAALVGGLLALSPFAPASANGSDWCTDSVPATTIPLVSGPLGLPLWLAVETDGVGGGVCYGSGAPGQPKTIGGYLGASAWTTPNGAGAGVSNTSDDGGNSAVQAPARASVEPSYSLNPGTASGGQEIRFQIPGSFCSGPCYPAGDPGLGSTGVIVGTLQQTPTAPGGTSASYRLTELCIQLDGNDVPGTCRADYSDTGVTTTGSTGPVTAQPATPGPCVTAVCAPNYTYIGTSSQQIGTVYLAVLGPIPVYGVHTCLYRNADNVQCPE